MDEVDPESVPYHPAPPQLHLQGSSTPSQLLSHQQQPNRISNPNYGPHAANVPPPPPPPAGLNGLPVADLDGYFSPPSAVPNGNLQEEAVSTSASRACRAQIKTAQNVKTEPSPSLEEDKYAQDITAPPDPIAENSTSAQSDTGPTRKRPRRDSTATNASRATLRIKREHSPSPEEKKHAQYIIAPPNPIAENSTPVTNASQATFDVMKSFPQTRVSLAAYNLATAQLAPAIFSHSMRVYLYAVELAKAWGSSCIKTTPGLEILFTACILHNIGTAYNGPQRFEIEGADVARAFLLQNGVNDPDAILQIWMAIALYTSPGIAERIGELPRLVRTAVRIDFGFEQTPTGIDVKKIKIMKRELEATLPRADIEKVLAERVLVQAITQPSKAPAASWPNNIYKAYLLYRDSDPTDRFNGFNSDLGC
jgi:hypothetical protein